jgi:hypothetical protein
MDNTTSMVWSLIDKINDFDGPAPELIPQMRNLCCAVAELQYDYLCGMSNPLEFKLAPRELVQRLRAYNYVGDTEDIINDTLDKRFAPELTFIQKTKLIVRDLENYLVDAGINRDSVTPQSKVASEYEKSLDFHVNDYRTLEREFRMTLDGMTKILSDVLTEAHWGEGPTDEDFEAIFNSFRIQLISRVRLQFR